ncbi:beta-phosphoglucomutase family hydrolase [Spongiactinospora sp. TRM90649]|uniref:beta-phosphoglucomutase family hydrolase n=1 Tax=Spongiactinospora sp. TRM90649 TaxID=3031114 RepID=UPI0023F8ADD5|nr:beta-phosphoglucomutase family hydrolase [Spongiactinospora sp. TRM90649]MDF5752835.1 beta-phosphoglucomutase family hydrolase [Spongiactinospora sp. TRM90649]
MLGLPDEVQACLFDMDGVLTRTASVHADAWKTMFDDFLKERARRTGEPFVPFDKADDYDRYVDGKKRLDGTISFLRSRGIELPEGSPDDPSDEPTAYGLSNRKNAIVARIIDRQGVDVFPGSVRYLKAARDAGLRMAVVSSSANAERVLSAADLTGYFAARIDGVTVRRRNLAGKPAPDMYLAAAEALGLTAAQAAVFEDALAGVEAGRAGHFARVVGVDRAGHADALREHGADLVVGDLADLLPEE